MRLSYGVKKKEWVLEAPPHILMRAKRVFSKAQQGPSKALHLSDSPETARDLEWFISRYEPYEVSALDLERLQGRSSVHKEKESLVQRFLANPSTTRSFDLALPPRDYQKIAGDLILSTGALLLADDLGTGKTVSALCTLSDAKTLPALVVTMTSLPPQWEEQVNRFLPQLKTHVVKVGNPYDLTKAVAKKYKIAPQFPDVTILNYAKLARWAHTLSESGLKSVIFDEIQELRSGFGSKTPAKYQAAAMLSESAQYRSGLSATPIFNYGGEFYAVLNILFPGQLGSFEEFTREWCSHTYGDKPRLASPKAFGEYLRGSGMMLRRTRKDIARELPALQKIEHTVDANPEALNKVNDACMELARIILGEKEVKKGAKMLASEELSNKLRQATGVAKVPFVAEFVKMLAESGEKILVFAWHREVYSILLDRLKEFNPLLYTGSETVGQKERAKKAFCDGDSQILLMSLRSGAGLDGLQFKCSTVVFAELDWSPGVMDQCLARVYRDGQGNPVVAYYLTANTGSDPIVSEVLGLKLQQLDGALKPEEGDLLERLQVDPGHIKKLALSYLAKHAK